MSSQSNSRQVSVDYLIVGGGVQGLWTLKEILSLPKRHSVMLASRGPLGNGESLHGHNAITSAFGVAPLSRDKSDQIVESVDRLVKYLGSKGVHPFPTKGFFLSVVNNPEHALSSAKLESYWEGNGLLFDKINTNDLSSYWNKSLLEREGVSLVKAHGTHCISWADSIVALQQFEGASEKIVDAEMTSLEIEGDNVDSLKVKKVVLKSKNTSELISVVPRHLILNIGTWSIPFLLSTEKVKFSNEALRRQWIEKNAVATFATWKIPMVMIRGPSSLVLPQAGMFITLSKKFSMGYDFNKETDEVTWYITPIPPGDMIRDMTGFNPDIDPPVEAHLVNHAISAAFDMFPQLKKSAEGENNIKFGVYVGWRSEHPFKAELQPKTYHNTSYGIKNMSVTWPNLWANVASAADATLKESASAGESREAAIAEVESQQVAGLVQAIQPEPLRVGQRKEVDISFYSYKEFSEKYNISQ